MEPFLALEHLEFCELTPDQEAELAQCAGVLFNLGEVSAVLF